MVRKDGMSVRHVERLSNPILEKFVQVFRRAPVRNSPAMVPPMRMMTV